MTQTKRPPANPGRFKDEIAIVFCGSKKSLASGVPMMNVLFPAPMVGLMVLPLIFFHQIQ